MIARFPLVLLAAAAASCATGARVNRDAVFVESVLHSAARQVQRCYRAPRVGHDGRQIVTELRIRVAPGGALNGPPELISQSGVTPANRIHAEPMARAAIDAVVRCTPLRLPDSVYFQGPVEIDLLFSPLARA